MLLIAVVGQVHQSLISGIPKCLVAQTDGSVSPSESAEGIMSLRSVRAERCSIKVTICSTTLWRVKSREGSDCSPRALVAIDFAKARILFLA